MRNNFRWSFVRPYPKLPPHLPRQLPYSHSVMLTKYAVSVPRTASLRATSESIEVEPVPYKPTVVVESLAAATEITSTLPAFPGQNSNNSPRNSAERDKKGLITAEKDLTIVREVAAAKAHHSPYGNVLKWFEAVFD